MATSDQERVFFDTSAFVKLYIAEAGSSEAALLAREAETILVSALVLPEACSSLNRLRREGRIDEELYRQVMVRIGEDLAFSSVVPVTDKVIGRSIRLLEEAGLRAFDALHIAAALVGGAEIFVTTDYDQMSAARALGLKVVTPGMAFAE